VHFAHDGQDAVDFLSEPRSTTTPLPALVILDLKMPRLNGLEVLDWIRRQPTLRCLPVLMFSSSNRREDIENAYALGANGFLVKPASIVQREVIARFFKSWVMLNEAPLASTEGTLAARAAYDRRAANVLPLREGQSRA
jgi:CheY-like chemotaxis protein